MNEVVRPVSLLINLMKLKDPIFENKITLKSYPPEYIFSEKFEAIIYLKEINDRMKDYYDCYQLIKSKKINHSKIKITITETFNHRGTQIKKIPLYSSKMKEKWTYFLNRNDLSAPSLESIIKQINQELVNWKVLDE